MRCLLVEDEPTRVEVILPELQRLFGAVNVDVAGDRDTAKAAVERTAFDLVVLDQRIPTAPGQLDPELIHGRAVFDRVRDVAPDTPVCFLTGLPMEEDYINELIARGAQCDVWGDRKPVPLIQRFNKASMAPFYKAAAAIAATARITDDIEINTRGAGVQLNSNESRLIRCFARSQGGAGVDIEVLSDGLSGARVLKADIKDGNGRILLPAAGKLGPHHAIAKEIDRCERELSKLPAGTYAPLIPGRIAQVASSKGAFYRLLDGYDRSLFDVLHASDEDAARCVAGLQKCEAPWFTVARGERLRVENLVKLLIWEDRLPAIHALLDGIDWPRYEAREISVKMCTRHGDLHGENARVNAGLDVMLIDYGSVDLLPSAIDAVTLELSPFFHPHGLPEMLRWKPADGPIDWFDRPKFSSLISAPTYIAAARKWAHDEAFGDREVLACAYAYVLRQLQFPNTDSELARAFAAGIVARAMCD